MDGDARIEVVAVIPILSLGPQVGDALACLERPILPFVAESIAASLTPRGRRPDIASQQLEEYRLAGTVRTGQQPPLPRTELEPHVAQSPVTTEPHARVVDLDGAQAWRLPVRQSPRQRYTSPSGCTRPSSTSLIAWASSEYRA